MIFNFNNKQITLDDEQWCKLTNLALKRDYVDKYVTIDGLRFRIGDVSNLELVPEPGKGFEYYKQMRKKLRI